MLTEEFVVVTDGLVLGPFALRLQAVAEAFRLGVTSYDVHSILVVDLTGGF
jgi:hypothetical protein